MESLICKCTSITHEEVSVVHNGISDELKKDLEEKGFKFKSQTDTEVIIIHISIFLKFRTFKQFLKL